MSWILADIKSLFPLAQTEVSKVPQTGEFAPSFSPDSTKDADATALGYPLEDSKPSVLVFVRHLGCPFCQQTVQEQMFPLARKHEGIRFFLVTQADLKTTQDYIAALPVDQASSIPFDILPSPVPHSLYSTWGIAQLSWASVLSPAVISSAMDLARGKGIKNTTTVGSRWLNSGAFAVDGKGVVLWSHVATRADDVSNLEAAVNAIQAAR